MTKFKYPVVVFRFSAASHCQGGVTKGNFSILESATSYNSFAHLEM
jgi:hypothetical protein